LLALREGGGKKKKREKEKKKTRKEDELMYTGRMKKETPKGQKVLVGQFVPFAQKNPNMIGWVIGRRSEASIQQRDDFVSVPKSRPESKK